MLSTIIMWCGHHPAHRALNVSVLKPNIQYLGVVSVFFVL